MLLKWVPIASGVVAIATILIAYFYIDAKNAEIRGLESQITSLDQRVNTKDGVILQLEGRVEELSGIIDFQAARLEANIQDINDYKEIVRALRAREVPIFADLVSEVPAEVVIEEANEFTNTSITDIIDSANNFYGIGVQ